MGIRYIQTLSRKRKLWLLLTAVSIAFVLLCRWNSGLADWYMSAVYPVLASTLSFISTLFPFSLFDLLVAGALFLFIFSIVKLIRRKWKFRSWLYYFILSIVWVSLWFYLAWGVGYFRSDFYHRHNIAKTNVSTEAFERLCFRYIDSLNHSYVSTEGQNQQQVDEAIEQSYQQLHEQLGLAYPCGKRRTKHSLSEPLQTKVGVSGFFMPFFNEVHVNSFVLPPSYPFTLAHEKAHQLGVNSEAECNLYAAIVCTSSTNPQVKYSGYYELVSYLLSSLRKASAEAYKTAYARLDERVHKDYTDERTHWQQGINKGMAEAQTRMYDSYLKSNNVSSGIRNYSEVVELFLAWEQHHNPKRQAVMNTIAYFEIQSSDPQRDISFYSAVFGWHFVKEENLPIEYYRIETNGMYGGLLKRPVAVPPSHCGTNAFTCSIEVENFDRTNELILKAGGQIALPKFAITGKCWQGYFIDPDNNTFGIFEVDSEAR